MIQRNYKPFKKHFILMFLVLFVVASYGLGSVKAQNNEVNLNEIISNLHADNSDILFTDQYNDEDEIRVIIELEGDPAIYFAQSKGLKYKELPSLKKEELQEEIDDEQTDLLSEIGSQGIDINVENQFAIVANGISGMIKYGDISRIESLSGVSSVYIVNKYERPTKKPQMISSKDLVQAKNTWESEYGYKGEGMVIGIIDSGIDPSHKDMVITDDSLVELTSDEVELLASDKQLPGEYFTVKVPYGYNYADKNNEIVDLGAGASMHGMHVAGIAAANGDEENNGLKGVAPEAQLLGLKVFGNDPEMQFTYGDIYIKAIDDAIALGADVINMSLGSTAAFVDADDPEQQAIKRAVDNGVMMAISAGNSGYFGKDFYPLASNPDIGLVGAPGLSYESLQVASIENSEIQLDQMSITVGDETLPIAYKKQSSTPQALNVFGNNEMDVVYVEDGQPDKYEGKDVAGKIVFVVRTGGFFYAQIEGQAEEAGAAGVIVRGRESHGDYVSMALDSPTIPMVTLSISDGNMLEEKVLDAGGTMKVTFTGETLSVPNNRAGQLADSTSWGVTSNLDFKPEITAPGAQILSTLNDDQYGLMSGTSMAAPHVAGGSALVLQRVEEEFPDLEKADKVNMAKNLLMNTSVPITDPEGMLYTPRRQGAGLMQLLSAVNTPVVVTEKITGEAKVALREVGNEFSFTLTATNYSDEDVTYQVSANALTDLVEDGYNLLATQEIEEVTIEIDTPELTIPAGGSEDIQLDFDISGAEIELNALMENGYFVEGFVTLTDITNLEEDDMSYPTLTVPYVGFHGDWNDPPVIDALRYEDNSFYGFTGLVGSEDFLGYDSETDSYLLDKVAFSPNEDGIEDTVTPILSFLRNSTIVEYSILDEELNPLRKIRTDYNVRKDYYNGGRADYYSFSSTTEWDGFVKNKLVEDGLYYYQVKTQVDYEGKDPQILQIPVTVDTTAPEINDLNYDSDNIDLTIDAEDSGIGINYYVILIEGEQVDTVPYQEDTTIYEFATRPAEGAMIDVIAVDYAGNSAIESTLGEEDEGVPNIFATSPEALGIFDSLDMELSGYITDISEIDNLTLTGETVLGSPITVDLQWNEEENRYDFNTTISFSQDGVHEFYISGSDVVGNEIGFNRMVFVDSTAPTIDVFGLPENGYVEADEEDPTITVNLADNFDELRFLIDGSEEFYHPFVEPYEMRPITEELELTLPLEMGNNSFILEAVDYAGTVTTVVVSIYKGEEPPGAQITELIVDPEQYVSMDRPATINATASESILWDVKIIDPEGEEMDLPQSVGVTYETTFEPDEFTLNGTYTVVASGSIDGEDNVYGTEAVFTVYNYPLMIQSVDTLDGNGEAKTNFTQGENVKIQASIKNLGPDTAEDPLIIIQVKDDDQSVVYLGFFTLFEIADGATNGAGVQLNDFDKGTYTIDVFVWDQWDSPSALSEANKETMFTIE
ncbi:S8 family serine peptidase [Chengkuizengella marina]|uniref:Lactocepin n=1 Tax=Chengkuizengella marina TaxID=2507566 RepID=A0A6N9Q994_9BACL|nr:S8 family serine peptidase [Chengkuizengella marina]NBI31154.1 hypothetical protein [Chengkuizengella marina]